MISSQASGLSVLAELVVFVNGEGDCCGNSPNVLGRGGKQSWQLDNLGGVGNRFVRKGPGLSLPEALWEDSPSLSRGNCAPLGAHFGS